MRISLSSQTKSCKITITYNDIHTHCPNASCKGVILSRRYARPTALTTIEKYLLLKKQNQILHNYGKHFKGTASQINKDNNREKSNKWFVCRDKFAANKFSKI